MVINNNPSYAYLLEGNSLVDQKLVMAHVYGHVDFFKNNFCFSKTNRKMIDKMANHGARVRRHVERQGIEKVESFIDSCLCLENLIDPMSSFIVRKPPEKPADEEPEVTPEVPKLRAKDYMEGFINPAEYMAEQRQQAGTRARQAQEVPRRSPSGTSCCFY